MYMLTDMHLVLPTCRGIVLNNQSVKSVTLLTVNYSSATLTQLVKLIAALYEMQNENAGTTHVTHTYSQ